MKKIWFVTPWYGENISGGAEAALRDITGHLFAAGMEVEILSTCVKEFHSNWNCNYYRPGKTFESGGIPVLRFKVRKRNVHAFDEVNLKLMNGDMPLTAKEEETFVREMINSPDLYQYIREHKDEYAAFVFIPYMFGTTYYGVQECYEKAVMIPCFHEESYVYLKNFHDVFSRVAGMMFNAKPEEELTRRIFDVDHMKAVTMGLGVDTELTYDAARFREKYHINDPFILYAGRKDVGKNIYTLLDYYHEYLFRRNTNLKLVLLGGGDITIPRALKEHVIDLGFVPIQDKYDAYAAAELLCQPSKHESFSYVIMESWLCERPVLVHKDCNVTQNFAAASNGGLFFEDYFEFEGAVDYIMERPAEARIMALQGKKYVKENFAWDVMIEKYKKYFSELCVAE